MMNGIRPPVHGLFSVFSRIIVLLFVLAGGVERRL